MIYTVDHEYTDEGALVLTEGLAEALAVAVWGPEDGPERTPLPWLVEAMRQAHDGREATGLVIEALIYFELITAAEAAL